jgi:hypothetical protein
MLDMRGSGEMTSAHLDCGVFHCQRACNLSGSATVDDAAVANQISDNAEGVM